MPRLPIAICASLSSTRCCSHSNGRSTRNEVVERKYTSIAREQEREREREKELLFERFLEEDIKAINFLCEPFSFIETFKCFYMKFYNDIFRGISSRMELISDVLSDKEILGKGVYVISVSFNHLMID